MPNRADPSIASLEACMRAVPPLDQAAMAAARARLDSLSKPPGSLGRLERLAVQIAGITASPRPRQAHKAIVVMAGDHGVTAEGVSAYPREVTRQMVETFARGGAAINVLGRSSGARVVVVDMGVAAELDSDLPIVHRKIAHGTANFARQPAMTREQAVSAIRAGMDVLEDELARGVDVVCLGEMGIGNTSSASAIVATLTGLPVEQVTGRGTGIDDAAFARKVATLERALALHQPDVRDPLGVLTDLGGFEIGGLVGVALAAAARRIPVVLDGFISSAAGLLAAEMCPNARQAFIASHRSAEPGHRASLDHLELEPLLALDLRLGEGSGAALVLPILDAALALLHEMATFDEAGVSRATERPQASRDQAHSSA